MLDSEILNYFLDEAVNSLQEWEHCCFELEQCESAEAYVKLYRSAHNLKSVSHSVGLENLGNFVQQS